MGGRHTKSVGTKLGCTRKVWSNTSQFAQKKSHYIVNNVLRSMGYRNTSQTAQWGHTKKIPWREARGFKILQNCITFSSSTDDL